jgi:hypothetical protein
MKNWTYIDLLKELDSKPSKQTPNDNGQMMSIYYKDIADKVIHFGDTLEIKSLVGGYGRTSTFVGKLLSTNGFGTWCLVINGIKEYVSVNTDLDFDLLYKDSSDKIMVFNTTTKHGFGSYDVHAHNTYVKIL